MHPLYKWRPGRAIPKLEPLVAAGVMDSQAGLSSRAPRTGIGGQVRPPSLWEKKKKY